ncbi:MAG TPA: hypothetical protein VNK44_06560 [Candidatus Nitrosotenuis sp.]|nr:hypothetical protein [Candidatus Nitrosotenuis sp.]
MQTILFGLLAVTVVFGLQYAYAQQAEVPNYLKNKIKLWALDKMPDESFVKTLDELGQRGLLKIKQTTVQNAYSLPEYGKTTFVKITGRVNDYGLTSPVSLIIIEPDGLRTEYTVPVLQSGAYSTLIPLYFSSTPGTYKVIAYHNGKELPETFFYAKRETKIPLWIKNSAKLWIDGKTSEREFLSATQYLLDQKVIKLEQLSSKPRTDLDVAVNGHKAVRRGTTQDITVYVSNAVGAIEGATVYIRVENHDEDVLEEFKGVTDSNGTYNVSWELSKDLDDIETFLVFVDVTDGISSKTKLFSFQVYCLCGEPNCGCRN